MTVRIICGDCREVLRTLPDQSIQCVVTSPPYFGLRDYGTGAWSGGDTDCTHQKVTDPIAAVATSTLGGGKKTTGHLQEGYGASCSKCGATRIDSQIGLEASPAAYVAEMVAVFNEVRRVLRDDGTVWLNLGDSYSDGGSGANGRQRNQPNASRGYRDIKALRGVLPPKSDGAKPKDLLGIPWRVAFALQADGWYLRSAIVWAKPNPMPESVTDRPTSAYEMVFLLAKKERYFYDQDAIRWEPTGRTDTVSSFGNVPGRMDEDRKGKFTLDGLRGRNCPNVWTIATQPYSGSHFATMPPDLAERCIKAGSKAGDTILDPFSGAGTTALVADRLNRNAIGIELNPDYAAMGRNRVQDDAPLLAEVS